MSLKLALLCGGLATRLYPRTSTLPKSMIEVAGEPFIAHQLRLFARHGIGEVVLCCGHLAEQIESFVGDGARFGLTVRYSPDGEELRGTGGALKQALPLLGEAFMVTYGDSYLEVDYQQIADHFMRQHQPAMMTVFRNQGKWDTSNVVYDKGRILRYDKRAEDRAPKQRYDYIDYGLGLFRASLFEHEPRPRFDLADLYRRLVDSSELCGYEVFQRFYEIGSEEGILETDLYLRSLRHG